MQYGYNNNYPSQGAKTGIEFILSVAPVSPFTVFLINATQILRLLDNFGRRQLSSLIPPSQAIEIADCLDWRPRGVDLFDLDSMDCRHRLLERCPSVRDCIQPMRPCVLWTTKGVIR